MKAVIAKIDTKALIHNIEQIKKSCQDSKIIAIVKANAYGHGLYNVASTLSSYVDAFAVARIEEGLFLREKGINLPIILLEGFFEKEDIDIIADNNFYTAVHDLHQLECIKNSKPKEKLHCWIKANIGMHRLGLNSDEIISVKKDLEALDYVHKPIGLISHLSVADDDNWEDFHQEQINTFFEIAKNFNGDLCLANSAGIVKSKETHTTWVRPGIIMYGISPFVDKNGSDLNLKPVMTLCAKLIAKRKVKKGDRVGYGASWCAEKDTIIGIVSAGYGDGYPRTAPNGTEVWINNRIVHTAGHVCMDMLFVDLGIDSQDKIGDEVILWGEKVPVENLAKRCGTIPYELVCHIMPRVDVELY